MVKLYYDLFLFSRVLLWNMLADHLCPVALIVRFENVKELIVLVALDLLVFVLNQAAVGVWFATNLMRVLHLVDDLKAWHRGCTGQLYPSLVIFIYA